jgi:hypothetical protein
VKGERHANCIHAAIQRYTRIAITGPVQSRPRLFKVLN